MSGGREVAGCLDFEVRRRVRVAFVECEVRMVDIWRVWWDLRADTGRC